MSATSVAAFLRRDLLLLRRNTASLISMFVVPPLFLLCLYAVFGYSAGQSGFGYLRFVLGGCLFQAAMFTAAASAMAVGQDRTSNPGSLTACACCPGPRAAMSPAGSPPMCCGCPRRSRRC